MVLKTTTTMNIPMRISIQKTIGINGILRICNGVVACLIFSGFFREELTSHPYMDWLTLFLGLVLCLQTHLVLLMERRNPDPFVLIMTYLLTVFYALRIFTLLLYPVQNIFERFIYGPSDSNYALLYILAVNTFIYAGLYKVKLRDNGVIKIGGYQPVKPILGIVLFIISLLFGQIYQPEAVAPFINLIYNNFLTPKIILIVLAAYVIVFRNRLPSIYIKIVLCGALMILILQTLAFSRGGILSFVDNVLIVSLALLPTLRLRRKYVIIGFIMIPFLLAIALNVYALSTTARMIKVDKEYTLTEKVELLQESKKILVNNPKSDSFIGKAFARAGYFDFSAEIIANSDYYADTLTVGNYFKSIVDNLLTPGFDVFDQPKLSNSLKYAYSNNLRDVSISKDTDASYHTDHLGLYGEMYSLFNYASLFVVYFIAYLLKYAFRYKGRLSPRIIALNRVFILGIFFQWMNSFGLDWVLINIVFLGVSYYCLSKIFFLRIKSNKRVLDSTELLSSNSLRRSR